MPEYKKPFIIEEYIDPSLTAYFLRLGQGKKVDFVYALGALLAETPEDEDPYRDIASLGRGAARIIEGYDFTTEDWYTYVAVSAAARLGSKKGGEVLRDFAAIAVGGLVLSETDKQMLSNLSNGDLRTAGEALGLYGDSGFQFPLLDIGTGKDAWLARDLLKKHPGEMVVSTSMHLAQRGSPMFENLSVLPLKTVGALVACNAEGLPFADNSFQQVVSINAAPYYVAKQNVPTVLQNIHRVLKPGGTAYLCAALCDYGESEVGQGDIEPLQTTMDIQLEPIPSLGRVFYSTGVENLIKITK